MAYHDSYTKQLRRALQVGVCRRGNRAVYATDVQLHESLTAPATILSVGKIECTYHSTTIFTIDFKRKEMCTFGYDGYSMSTNWNIRGWARAFVEVLGDNAPHPYEAIRYSSGTNRRSTGQDTLWEAFATQCPWIVKRDYADGYWFNWEKFDQKLSDRYNTARSSLRMSQNHRYFTFAWSRNKTWDPFFLSEDAQRRWLNREKRNNRDVPIALPRVLGAADRERRDARSDASRAGRV